MCKRFKYFNSNVRRNARVLADMLDEQHSTFYISANWHNIRALPEFWLFNPLLIPIEIVDPWTLLVSNLSGVIRNSVSNRTAISPGRNALKLDVVISALEYAKFVPTTSAPAVSSKELRNVQFVTAK